MWRRYFKLKLVPGVVITQRYGRLDFRQDDLSVHMLQQLYEEDFPYLELTTEGKRVLYGVQTELAAEAHVPSPDITTGGKRKVSRKKNV